MKLKVNESELVDLIHKVISEGGEAGGGRGVVPGGTSSSSSGAYISAAAWEEGGVLTKSGRGNDMGELPKTVDITGGNYGSFEIPAQQPGTFQYGNEYGDGDPHGGGGRFIFESGIFHPGQQYSPPRSPFRSFRGHFTPNILG